jgi:hypothetical protein
MANTNAASLIAGDEATIRLSVSLTEMGASNFSV